MPPENMNGKLYGIAAILSDNVWAVGESDLGTYKPNAHGFATF